MKMQATDWEKIITKHIIKGLVYRIYKELNNNVPKNLI